MTRSSWQLPMGFDLLSGPSTTQTQAPAVISAYVRSPQLRVYPRIQFTLNYMHSPRRVRCTRNTRCNRQWRSHAPWENTLASCESIQIRHSGFLLTRLQTSYINVAVKVPVNDLRVSRLSIYVLINSLVFPPYSHS